MSRYLLTGVAGFIGSAVAEALIGLGHEVVGVDNLSSGLRRSVPKEVRFIWGDVTDEGLYRGALPGGTYDAIFHIAGEGSDLFTAHSLGSVRANIESTALLANFALSRGVSRFIYASSMAVYGPQPDDAFRVAGEALTEDTPPNPVTPFGLSKLTAERYLALYAQKGLKPTCLRLFSVYGPGRNENHPTSGLLNSLMTKMIMEGHIHLHGNPNRFRDFVYIDDAVQAFISCLTHPASNGRAINIGSGGKVIIGDMVEILRSLPGTPVTVEYSGTPTGDHYSLCADPATAAQCLGYEAEMPLIEGLRHTYNWYKKRSAVD